MGREVLLLNTCEQILKVIDWKRAVKLLLAGKATAPYTKPSVKSYRIRTTEGSMEVPSAIVLVRFYEIPQHDLSPTRRNIFKRDKNTCQYCGRKSKNTKSLTIDHVHPRCKGGDNGWTNLTTACLSCNQKKGNKLLKECDMELLNKPRKPKSYLIHIQGIDENSEQMWDRWLQY